MEEFENLQGFLEHISLVMDTDKSENGEAVSVMTLHSAKGLEFDTVFLPGWEEGLFPHQRTLDDQGRAGLEEERRLAHVGITRARLRAKIYFATEPARAWLVGRATSRRASWTSCPRRMSRCRNRGAASADIAGMAPPASTRCRTSVRPMRPRAGSARRRAARGGFEEARRERFRPGRGAGATRRASPPRAPQRRLRAPLTIEGELVASSTGPVSPFAIGDRVFHLKFGNGNVTAVDGNKLSIQFDKAGEKRVVDSFVERV